MRTAAPSMTTDPPASRMSSLDDRAAAIVDRPYGGQCQRAFGTNQPLGGVDDPAGAGQDSRTVGKQGAALINHRPGVGGHPQQAGGDRLSRRATGAILPAPGGSSPVSDHPTRQNH